MKISSFKLKNYRRLYDTELVLDDQKTILVGANNSGKTSCIGALHTFLVRPENLRVRDISKQNWQSLSAIGTELCEEQISTEQLEALAARLTGIFPKLDVILSAKVGEAYKARAILPHLEWRGGELSMRIAYEPENIAKLVSDFSHARGVVASRNDVSLWPKNLFDFLEKGSNFSKYIKQKHYILGLEDVDGKTSRLQPLSNTELKKLVRVDVISEQRGLGTEDSSTQRGPFSEKQRLNKLLREYYDRFLNPDDFPEAGDLDVLKMQQEMENSFTQRLGSQFEAPLSELETMGYPGIGGNPSVEITAKISGADALQKASSVGYRFDKEEEDSLPESYLGLGYQNLIYLTFRLLEFRDRWMRKGKSASADDDLVTQIEPIHLVLVEEPEVNLHAQVQRVFIAKAYGTLRNHDALKENAEYQTQLVVSTHSSHIVNNVDFKDLRYFRRSSATDTLKMEHTSVENMSDLFNDDNDELKFVSKHLKLTHCDIFFADAILFVEGQAERLLVPEFINKGFERLSKRYLSILEVSGAHTHKYRQLIEKLGVVALVFTDLDSLNSESTKHYPELGQNQTTSNFTLRNWHPKKDGIDDLISLPEGSGDSGNQDAPLFVAYQKAVDIEGSSVLSRTFEDALILANLDDPYFQGMTKIATAKIDWQNGTTRLEASLFDFVQKLTKGDFAFNCLFHLAETPDNSFNPPAYMDEGLKWLDIQLSPSS